MGSVLAILTCWRRPDGTALCAQELMQQCRVAVVDNAGTYRGPADELWRFPDQGPPSRWMPAVLNRQHKYVYFHDEDMLPGKRVIEGFHEAANQLKGQFSTLTQAGRRYLPGPNGLMRYSSRGVVPTPRYEPVDNGCRAHFVAGELLIHAISFHQEIWDRGYGKLARVHDDLLLCLGIQRAIGKPTFLLPSTQDTDQLCCVKNLPDNDAVSHRLEHYNERTDFVNLAKHLGWRSLWREHGAVHFESR